MLNNQTIGLCKLDDWERWWVRRNGSWSQASSIVILMQGDDSIDPSVVEGSGIQQTVRTDGDTSQLRLFMETIPQLVWRSFDEGRWDWVGPQWAAYTGQPALQSHGLGWLEMVHPEDRVATLQAWSIARERSDLDVEYRLRRVDGAYRWFQSRAKPYLPADNGDAGRYWSGTSTDMDSLRQAQDRVRYLEHHDRLTGAANRARLQQVLDDVMRDADGSRICSLLLIDVRRFRLINKCLGHRGGDELLKQVAVRLQRALPDADLLARSGDDEFAIVHHLVPRQTARDLTTRIKVALAEPLQINGQEVSPGTSIGVALGVQDGNDSGRLLHCADVALHEAKISGFDVCFYDPSLEVRHHAKRLLERDLREAVGEGGLDVHYQPITDLLTNVIVAYEALARWRHPEHGWISPGRFIPLAEETSLIVQLGSEVMGLACRAAQSWPGHERVAVNVSPAQFHRRGLVRMVARVLEETGLPASRLELEITEGLLMEDSDQTRSILCALKDLGVRIVLDDFGTGFSNLGYLCRFPFDKVKIDRSFVGKMDDDRNALAIVKAVVALGDSMDLQVTAEGVETFPQLSLLREIGCRQAQGFLLGKPTAAIVHPRLQN